MSRKTLLLTLLSQGVLAAGGCAGTDGAGRKTPENCTDGIDNDADGLVDCDDKLECGGLQCILTTTTDTGPTAPPASAEILFDPTECCDFTFAQGDGSKIVGTYQAADRESEIDGALDASCDLIGGAPPLSFSVEGCPNCPIPYLTNQPIDPDTTVTVEVWFELGVTQTFTATCRTKLDVDPFSDEYEFEVTGTRLDP